MSLFKTLVIILFAYFVAGAMFLPEGDFSTLPDMPKMYASCKLEDPEMSLPDFISEHLLAIDGLIDDDGAEPGEKPHKPIQFNHQFAQIIITAKQFSLQIQEAPVAEPQLSVPANSICLAGYTASVFRPPIV